MRLAELSPDDMLNRLRGEGLCLKTGPFNFRIVSPIESVARGLRLLYADYAVVDDTHFIDFTVTLLPSPGWRAWWRAQVNFVYDGEHPFLPLPIDHAFALLEWAMNWCISTQAHQYLTLHAAVLERHGLALVMPAASGSGKSTLAAALCHRGWRLLSDELTLVSLHDVQVSPLSRPVSLKNNSLAVIDRFVPGATFTPPAHDTFKGTVCHMKVPGDQVARMDERALPAWLVFPQFVADAPAALRRRTKANSLLELCRHAFNYSVAGLEGFEALSHLVSGSACYDFSYGRLEEAVGVFEQLAHAEAA
jgi:hypothetical protein